MPAIGLPDWTDEPGGPNPLTGIDLGPHSEKALGDAGGLTQFGVRIERLPPGSRSSYRHWHETEDEFLYLLEGEAVLIEDVETPLGPGDAVAWPAAKPVAHCIENRSDAPVTYLIVGTRAASGVVHYPDNDVIMHHDASGRRFTRTDGTPIWKG